jgi:molybdopterin molybdotransferase
MTMSSSERTTPVFGLPGNPVSTLVAFELFLRPALLAMQSASMIDRPRVPAVLAQPYRKQAGRAHYLRAHLTREGERLIAHVHAKQGSAQQSSLVGTGALLEIPIEATDLDAGSLVNAILLDAV